ncbi:MAG: porin family protein [Candidatus Aminicenantes bacterium]|nr:porin family protein [Candidatus Aminicenantes bacterium]
MRKAGLFLCGLALSLALPRPASAQAGIYMGLQGGLSLQKPSLEGVDFGTDTTFLYGLKAGVKLLMFAVEAQYFQAAHNLRPEDLAALDWDGRRVDYSFAGLSLKYLFSLVMVHPYLCLGYGYYEADIPSLDTDRKKGYNLGAGVELMLGPKFALAAEGRYHRVTFDAGGSDLKLGDFTLSAAIHFYF